LRKASERQTTEAVERIEDRRAPGRVKASIASIVPPNWLHHSAHRELQASWCGVDGSLGVGSVSGCIRLSFLATLIPQLLRSVRRLVHRLAVDKLGVSVSSQVTIKLVRYTHGPVVDKLGISVSYSMIILHFPSFHLPFFLPPPPFH
jgi:hypothetical protein